MFFLLRSCFLTPWCAICKYLLESRVTRERCAESFEISAVQITLGWGYWRKAVCGDFERVRHVPMLTQIKFRVFSTY